MKNTLSKLCLAMLTMAFLTGCAQQSYYSADIKSNELGTAWCESVHSRSKAVQATRVSENTPDDTLMVFYSGNQNIIPTLAYIPLVGNRLEFAVVDDNLRPIKIGKDDNNKYRLEAVEGQSYQLIVRNRSAFPYEIVATIDGLDVINGQSGSYSNNGYIVEGYSSLVIEGFRQSNQSVAKFRFSSKKEAYANNTPSGSEANIGVIGVAAFALMSDEALSVKPSNKQITPNAFPEETSRNKFAPAPSYAQ